MNDETKRLSAPLQIKFGAAKEAGEFSAYASTFGGPPDSYGDIIARGAFANSLAAHKAAGTTPALLWSHDQSQPIGVITRLVEDSKGLLLDGQLALDVAKAKEAHALMKLGGVGMSIGYRVVKASPASRSGRQLDEIKLFEISAVAIPANPAAKVLSVKTRPNLFDQHNPRVIERILRDSGVSHKQAMRIISLGSAAFSERDVLAANDKFARKIAAVTAAIAKSF
jgi:HK97 family phage prohead protease